MVGHFVIQQNNFGSTPFAYKSPGYTYNDNLFPWSPSPYARPRIAALPLSMADGLNYLQDVQVVSGIPYLTDCNGVPSSTGSLVCNWGIIKGILRDEQPSSSGEYYCPATILNTDASVVIPNEFDVPNSISLTASGACDITQINNYEAVVTYPDASLTANGTFCVGWTTEDGSVSNTAKDIISMSYHGDGSVAVSSPIYSMVNKNCTGTDLDQYAPSIAGRHLKAYPSLVFNFFDQKNQVPHLAYKETALNVLPGDGSHLRRANPDGSMGSTAPAELGTGKDLLYPNPTTGNLTIEMSEFKTPVSATIMNNLGESVMKTQLNSGKSTIDVSKLAKGLYHISYSNNGTVVNKSFEVQ
jgi:Secretion system C-terminal sorting domain